MGNTCGCGDKTDLEQEVRVDPVRLFFLLTEGNSLDKTILFTNTNLALAEKIG